MSAAQPPVSFDSDTPKKLSLQLLEVPLHSFLCFRAAVHLVAMAFSKYATWALLALQALNVYAAIEVRFWKNKTLHIIVSSKG